MHLMLLSLFSGILLIFSFPTPDLPYLAWIGLIPLFFILQEVKNGKQLFLYTFLAGFVFWSGLIYWLLYLATWSTQDWMTSVSACFAYFGLSVSLALFFYFFAWPCWKLRQKRGISFIWSAPIFWVSMEYIRTYFLTGFPWGFIGASQYEFLPLIQISEWTGVYGVSFLVVLGNAWLFEIIYAILKKRKRVKLLEALAPVLLVILTLTYGSSLMSASEVKENPKLKVSLIQGNIPQDVKWSEEYEDTIHKIYEDLTLSAVENEKPDLVIWPETALPSYVRFDTKAMAFVTGLMKKIEIPLLLGASDAEQNMVRKKDHYLHQIEVFNSAFLVLPEVGFNQQYNKIHLVPFGEYVPLSWIPFFSKLTPIQDNYSSGKEFNVLDFSIPFSVVICFEDIFPNLVRQFVKNGAKWIVNMTNDGWFKNSSAPMQHAALSVFRSVENRVWLARSTNTGVSCFINPLGKIEKQLQDKKGRNVWISGTLTHSLGSGNKTTFYTRFGDVFSWLMLIFGFGFILSMRRGANK